MKRVFILRARTIQSAIAILRDLISQKFATEFGFYFGKYPQARVGSAEL